MQSLVKRGYNLGLIHAIFDEVTGLTQNDLIKKKQKLEQNKIPFIIPFNANTTKIGQSLQRHWHLIKGDPELDYLALEQPVLAMKRNKNLCDILVHSKFK